jgi:hypothetical protein
MYCLSCQPGSEVNATPCPLPVSVACRLRIFWATDLTRTLGLRNIGLALVVGTRHRGRTAAGIAAGLLLILVGHR